MIRQQGMPAFLTVWAGQMISTFGSSLVSFALGIWIYQTTDSVSLLALNMLAWLIPSILLSPVAGVYADRMNRRTLMIIGDTGAALSSLAIFVILLFGSLELWHIYVATLVNASCTTFQWPAYAAAVPQMVPEKHLGRANGLVQAEGLVAYIFAPAMAGLLLGSENIELVHIILIDVVTFGVAMLSLLLVYIPLPEKPDEDAENQGFWAELKEGSVFVLARKGMFGLLIYYMLLKFLQEFTYPLIQPLLLEIATPQAMGMSLSIMSIGMVVGVAVLSIWGGPKRRIRWIILFTLIGGVAMIGAGLRPNLGLITISGFIYFMILPLVEGLDMTFWQTNVPAHLQGRVFSLVNAMTSAVRPLALLLVGPLADRFFTPALSEDGLFSAMIIGDIFGVGAGRGIGLFISILGLITAIVSIVVYLYKPISALDNQIKESQP